MKKILLTFLAGFCFTAMAMAQEPAKAASAKKKVLKTAVTKVAADSEAAKAKEAEKKGIFQQPAAAPKASQSAAALTDPRSN